MSEADKYVLVPVLVEMTDEYVELVDQQSPNDGLPIKNAVVRKLVEADISEIGDLKYSKDIEDVIGAQIVKL